MEVRTTTGFAFVMIDASRCGGNLVAAADD
jgi:hypothetical protein